MDPFYRRMKHYVEVGDADLAPLLESRHVKQTYSAGQTIVSLGERVDSLFVIENGWAMRNRHLEDGRRQIINFALPGDYFDLMSLIGAKSDHRFTAATDCVVRAYDAPAFLSAIQSSPQLSSAFWWVTVQEDAIMRNQIVRIGRMSARERIANMVLELNRRQNIAHGRRDDFVPLPVPQALLADALGMSVVHVSRSITSMKADQLIQSTRQGITVLDRDRMMDLGQFDPALMEPMRASLAAQ